MVQIMQVLKMSALSKEATISYEWHRRTKHHALFPTADGASYIPWRPALWDLYVNCQLQKARENGICSKCNLNRLNNDCTMDVRGATSTL